jgi:hypothetical protein
MSVALVTTLWQGMCSISIRLYKGLMTNKKKFEL